VNDWETTTLGEVCSLITDGKHGDCANDDHSGFYFISAKDIRDGRIVYENARQIKESDFAETHRRTNLQPGDVLVTNSGTIGRLAVAGDDEKTFRTTFQKSVAILKPKSPEISSWFLYYYLAANTSELIHPAAGAAQKNLLLGDIRRFHICKPTLAEQDRISGVIRSYDALIENNRRRIALLEEAARMLYREWFVRFRFPGHEHVKIIDSLPEGWEGLSASAAFEINPSTPRNGDDEILYVPMAALSEAGMTVDRGHFELRDKSTNVRFRNGDTLFARITPCLENGKTGFVNFLQENEVACGSTEFIVLRGRRVSPYFVYLTARQNSFRENAIKSMIGSSGRQRVQDSCFNRYRVPTAPSMIASVFDETVAVIFEQIGTLDQANQKLAKARDLLLPRLKDGEMAV
jgi:type I restriction enzyme S subunit